MFKQYGKKRQLMNPVAVNFRCDARIRKLIDKGAKRMGGVGVYLRHLVDADNKRRN